MGRHFLHGYVNGYAYKICILLVHLQVILHFDSEHCHPQCRAFKIAYIFQWGAIYVIFKATKSAHVAFLVNVIEVN